MKKILLALAMAGAMTMAPAFGGDAWADIPLAAPSYAAAAEIIDFSVTDLRDGSGASLAQLCADKPLLLNFWASWCPPCVGEMPHIEAMYGKYGDRINFAAVSVDDSAQEARSFTQGRGAGLQLPFYYGDAGEISYAYQLQAIPMTLLVAPGGKIIDQHLGGMTQDMLEDFLQAAL